MSRFSSLLTSQFSAPVAHPQLNLIKQLKAEHPTSHHLSIVKCSDGQFPLSAYLNTLSTIVTIVEQDTHSIQEFNPERQEIFSQVVSGISEFAFERTDFRVYKASWQMNFTTVVFWHVVFDGADDSVGRKLVGEVYRWADSLKDEIWVYDGGFWSKNKALYKAVRSATWDEVILEDSFKEDLRRDTQTFFASKDIYASLGITWKRGLLLLGPPGNGKTESIKALLTEIKATPLYVKTFTTRNGPEQGIRDIFEHARQHSPCVLILEDLDAMVTPDARSFFLNELDGLAGNDGILTIATTNHPERIDDAILNRPSRFDVKYNFALPDVVMRKTFALRWLAKIRALGPATGAVFEQDENEIATEIAEKTDSWSYAFLKELFVSFLLRLAHDKSLRQTGVDVPQAKAEVLLLKQVESLENQILKVKEVETAQKTDGSMTARAGASMSAQFAMRATRAGRAAGAASVSHSGVNF